MKSGIKIPLLRESFLAQTGAIFLCGFCVRLIYLYFNGATGGYDTLDYLKLADNLYNFGAYSLNDFPNFIPSIRRAPGYPYFLAFLQLIEGGEVSQWSVGFVQCVLDGLTGAAVFLLARKVVSNPLAVAAAVFYILHPGAIARTRLILTESLFTFLLIFGVLALIEGFEKEKKRLLVFAGFLFGLVILTRPLAIIFPVLIILAVCFKLKSEKKYRYSAIFGVICLLTLAPWLVRCYRVTGRLVFVQGVSAFQFYAPTRVDLEQWDEKKLWKDYFDPNTTDEYFRKLASAQTPADYIEAEKTGRRKAFENIQARPKEYLISRVKTYPYFFITSFDNFTGIDKSYRALFVEKSFPALAIKILLLLVFSLLPFALSLIGVRRAAQNMTALISALLWISVLLIHLPLWVEYRFWIPFVPFQMISAAGGLAALGARFVPQKTLES